jgi:hypothetical protein
LAKARPLEQKTLGEGVTLDESVDTFDKSQCDQIGQNFAIWVNFFSIRQTFFKKKIAQ